MRDARLIRPMLAAMVAAALTSTASGEPGSAALRQMTKAACGLGADVIREGGSASPLVFEGAARRPLNYAALVNDPHLAGKIPEGLAAAANRAFATNLFVDCPALVAALPAGARMATDEDRAKLHGPRPAPRPYITTIYTPILDRRGDVALVFEYHDCGDLCGNGALYLYQRRAGRWVRSERLVGVLS